MADIESILDQARVSDPEGFWAEQAETLTWTRTWDRVLDWKPPFAKWFVGDTTTLEDHSVLARLRQEEE